MELLDENDVETLRRIADRMRENSGDVVYGYFPGGDPREFTPDPECCTEEEMANYERACKLMDEDKITSVDGRHHWPIEKDGEVIGHVTHAAFGLGTYTATDGDIEKLAEQLDQWIDAVRKVEDRYK
jgi:hypothetical protein